jgi:hypothetical protein
VTSLSDVYVDEGLEAIAVHFDDPRGNVDRYVGSMNIQFSVGLNGDALAELVGMKETPAIFFLDRNDNVTFFYSSSIPGDPVLEKEIRRIVFERTAYEL